MENQVNDSGGVKKTLKEVMEAKAIRMLFEDQRFKGLMQAMKQQDIQTVGQIASTVIQDVIADLEGKNVPLDEEAISASVQAVAKEIIKVMVAEGMAKGAQAKQLMPAIIQIVVAELKKTQQPQQKAPSGLIGGAMEAM